MSADTVRQDAEKLLDELIELEKEMRIVLPYTTSLWDKHPKHFPYTTYGFTMCLFSKIDLFSQYWFPSIKNRTKQMVSFLTTYLAYPEKESEIATQLWRHKLMHTSQPRMLTEQKAGKRYRWLLQHKLEPTQHWCFEAQTDPVILNVGLFNFVADLKTGLQKCLDELPNRRDVAAEWPNVTERLGSFETKY